MQFEMSVGTDYSTVTFKTFGHANMKIVFERLGGKMTDNSYLNWLFPSFITSEVLEEVIRNTCFVCGGLMKDDLKDVNHIAAIPIRKCTVCGHSHT